MAIRFRWGRKQVIAGHDADKSLPALANQLTPPPVDEEDMERRMRAFEPVRQRLALLEAAGRGFNGQSIRSPRRPDWRWQMIADSERGRVMLSVRCAPDLSYGLRMERLGAYGLKMAVSRITIASTLDPDDVAQWLIRNSEPLGRAL